MISHELPRHAPQRLLDRSHLRHDVGAVPILLNHLLQSAHLPFDAAQPPEVGRLDRRIDGDGATSVSIGVTAAERPSDRTMLGRHYEILTRLRRRLLMTT